MNVTIIHYVVAFILAVCLLAWRFGDKGANTHGSASWCPVWRAFRRGLFQRKGLRVGSWAGRLSVYHDATHAITFGAAGAGKGVSAIVPNLLALRAGFVIDPGGENAAVAAKALRKRGVAVGCINVFGMFSEAPASLPQHGFNPFDFLNPEHPTFAADALVFAEMLTPRAGNEGGSSAYFKDAAQRIKRALIVHIKTSAPEDKQSLATLYEAVNGDAQSWTNLLAEMKANPACGGLVTQEANVLERIESQASEEFSAIMSTIQQDLSFLGDPLVRTMLSRSDVDFSIIKGRNAGVNGGVVFVVLPLEYMESHAAIPRLALACAVLEMQRAPLARMKVLFLIDEAAALGKILRLANWHATLRKYRAVFWTIWQSLGQLKKLYDHDGETIMGNCNLKQFLNFRDLVTARYGEELAGRTTVTTTNVSAQGDASTGEAGRALIMADELLRLPEGQQLAFIDNLPPLLLAKTAYWQQPDLQGLYDANPYFGGSVPQPSARDRLALLWGRLYYAAVCLMAPHRLVFAAVWLPALVFAVDPGVPLEHGRNGDKQVCTYVSRHGIERYEGVGRCPRFLTRWGNL